MILRQRLVTLFHERGVSHGKLFYPQGEEKRDLPVETRRDARGRRENREGAARAYTQLSTLGLGNNATKLAAGTKKSARDFPSPSPALHFSRKITPPPPRGTLAEGGTGKLTSFRHYS